MLGDVGVDIATHGDGLREGAGRWYLDRRGPLVLAGRARSGYLCTSDAPSRGRSFGRDLEHAPLPRHQQPRDQLLRG